MISAVLETNVLISSFVRPEGLPGEIREMGLAGKFEPCTSRQLLDEVRDVLTRPKLLKGLKYDRESLEQMLSQLQPAGPHVEFLDVHRVVPNDPDDDIVVATAIATGASVIVSGDAHLLALGEHRGVRVVAPREFVLLLRAPQ